MKNLVNNAIIRKLFGKALVIGFLTSTLAMASFAQATANLYYANNRARYGRIVAYNGSHYEIYTQQGAVIKTFRNTCSYVTSGGVGGYRCTFGEFRNGQHNLSGWGYFFANGIVYLSWTNERVAGNQWRTINTGWYTFVSAA